LSGNDRVFGLDLLRAFAVLVVVYTHGSQLIKGTWVTDIIPLQVYRLGVFDGVTIFFVLSGFLIGRILLRTVTRERFDGNMLLEFWIRRWFRTLPNYFFVLTFLVVSSIIIRGKTPPDLVHFYTFTQNFASPHPPFFGEAWSLSVEEWFYLLIPIPLYFSTKANWLNRNKTILSWIFTVIVACTLFRIFRVFDLDIILRRDLDLNLRKQVLTRMDSLMYGVLGLI
jgi:peptidoglycan/LPS O-acetylase OafA/YrhL